MMKRFIYALCFVEMLSLYSGLFANTQSIFVPRAIITDSSFDSAFEYNRCQSSMYSLSKKEYLQNKTHASATALYMTSNSGNDLARCFFPNNKPVITIAEDGTGDIGSAWVGLIAPANADFFFSVSNASKAFSIWLSYSYTQ